MTIWSQLNDLIKDGELTLGPGIGSIHYIPTLDCLVSCNKDGDLKVQDCTTGQLLQITNIHSKNYFKVRIVGGKVVVVRDDMICSRNTINGVYLLKTLTQGRGVPPEEEASLEILYNEAVQLAGSLEKFTGVAPKWLRDRLLAAIADIDEGQLSSKQAKWCVVVIKGNLNDMLNVYKKVMELLSNSHLLPTVASMYDKLYWIQGVEDNNKPMSELARLRTFTTWPHTTYKWTKPEDMARAGFFFQPMHQGNDRAVCFHCNISLICWESTDEPWSEHERHSLECSFIKGGNTTNVPINVTLSGLPSHSISDHYGKIVHVSPNSLHNYIAITTDQNGVLLYYVKDIPELYAVIDCKLNSDLTSITSVCVTDTNTLTVTVGMWGETGPFVTVYKEQHRELFVKDILEEEADDVGSSISVIGVVEDFQIIGGTESTTKQTDKTPKEEVMVESDVMYPVPNHPTDLKITSIMTITNGVLLTLRGEESLLVVYNKDLYHKSHIFEGGSLVDVCVLPMHMHDPPESIIVTLTRKEGSDSTEQFLSFYNDYFKLLFTKNIDLIVGNTMVSNVFYCEGMDCVCVSNEQGYLSFIKLSFSQQEDKTSKIPDLDTLSPQELKDWVIKTLPVTQFDVLKSSYSATVGHHRWMELQSEQQQQRLSPQLDNPSNRFSKSWRLTGDLNTAMKEQTFELVLPYATYVGHVDLSFELKTEIDRCLCVSLVRHDGMIDCSNTMREGGQTVVVGPLKLCDYLNPDNCGGYVALCSTALLKKKSRNLTLVLSSTRHSYGCIETVTLSVRRCLHPPSKLLSLLENSLLHTQLVAALESPVEDIELTANLLYLLHWLLSIVQHDMVCLLPGKLNIDLIVEKCLVKGSRKTAHLAMRLLMLCCRASKNFILILKKALLGALPKMLQFNSSGSIRYYFLLMQFIGPDIDVCIGQLLSLTDSLDQPPSATEHSLRQCGVYENPFKAHFDSANEQIYGLLEVNPLVPRSIVPSEGCVVITSDKTTAPSSAPEQSDMAAYVLKSMSSTRSIIDYEVKRLMNPTQPMSFIPSHNNLPNIPAAFPVQTIRMDLTRLHGFRHNIVVDFGRSVHLTDIIVQKCPGIQLFSVEVWSEGEECDIVRLCSTSDLSTQALVLADIEPPPECRFIRFNMSGQSYRLAKQSHLVIEGLYGRYLASNKDKACLTEAFRHINNRYIMQCQTLTGILQQVSTLSPANGLTLESLISSSKYYSQRLSIPVTDFPAQENMFPAQENKFTKRDEALKIQTMCQSVSDLQLQLNRIQMQLSSYRCGSDNPDRLLKTCTMLVDTILYGLGVRGDSTSVSKKNLLILFRVLCLRGPDKLSQRTVAVLALSSCNAAWWPDFIEEVLDQYFSSKCEEVFDKERVYLLLVEYCSILPAPVIIRTMKILLNLFKQEETDEEKYRWSLLLLFSLLSNIEHIHSSDWMFLNTHQLEVQVKSVSRSSIPRRREGVCKPTTSTAASPSTSKNTLHLAKAQADNIQVLEKELKNLSKWTMNSAVQNHSLLTKITEIKGHVTMLKRQHSVRIKDVNKQQVTSTSEKGRRLNITLPHALCLTLCRKLIENILQPACEPTLFLISCKIVSQIASLSTTPLYMHQMLTFDTLYGLLRIISVKPPNSLNYLWVPHAAWCLVKNLSSLERSDVQECLGRLSSVPPPPKEAPEPNPYSVLEQLEEEPGLEEVEELDVMKDDKELSTLDEMCIFGSTKHSVYKISTTTAGSSTGDLPGLIPSSQFHPSLMAMMGSEDEASSDGVPIAGPGESITTTHILKPKLLKRSDLNSAEPSSKDEEVLEEVSVVIDERLGIQLERVSENDIKCLELNESKIVREALSRKLTTDVNCEKTHASPDPPTVKCCTMLGQVLAELLLDPRTSIKEYLSLCLKLHAQHPSSVPPHLVQLVLHKMDSDSLGNTEVWSLLLSLILHSHSAISTGTLLSFISRLLSNHPDRTSELVVGTPLAGSSVTKTFNELLTELCNSRAGVLGELLRLVIQLLKDQQIINSGILDLQLTLCCFLLQSAPLLIKYTAEAHQLLSLTTQCSHTFLNQWTSVSVHGNTGIESSNNKVCARTSLNYQGLYQQHILINLFRIVRSINCCLINNPEGTSSSALHLGDLGFVGFLLNGGDENNLSQGIDNDALNLSKAIASDEELTRKLVQLIALPFQHASLVGIGDEANAILQQLYGIEPITSLVKPILSVISSLHSLPDLLYEVMVTTLIRTVCLTEFIKEGGIDIILGKLYSNPSVLHYMETTYMVLGNSKEPPKMTNFAPICTITGTSKSGQLPNPTNLLQGSLTSRRMRTAAWSAHYSKTGDWITMLITCPIVILLQEVQIVPHNSSPTAAPGVPHSVIMEIGDEEPQLVLPASSNSGLVTIRLQLNVPAPVRKIRLHLYRPVDSDLLNLSMLRVLGYPAFGKVPTCQPFEGKLPKGVPKIELQEDKSHQWTDVLRQMIIMCTEPLLNLIKGPLMSALGTLLHLLDSSDKLVAEDVSQCLLKLCRYCKDCRSHTLLSLLLHPSSSTTRLSLLYQIIIMDLAKAHLEIVFEWLMNEIELKRCLCTVHVIACAVWHLTEQGHAELLVGYCNDFVSNSVSVSQFSSLLCAMLHASPSLIPFVLDQCYEKINYSLMDEDGTLAVQVLDAMSIFLQSPSGVTGLQNSPILDLCMNQLHCRTEGIVEMMLAGEECEKDCALVAGILNAFTRMSIEPTICRYLSSHNWFDMLVLVCDLDPYTSLPGPTQIQLQLINLLKSVIHCQTSASIAPHMETLCKVLSRYADKTDADGELPGFLRRIFYHILLEPEVVQIEVSPVLDPAFQNPCLSSIQQCQTLSGQFTEVPLLLRHPRLAPLPCNGALICNTGLPIDSVQSLAGILAGLPYPMMHNVSIREHSEGVPEGATTLQHIVDSKGGGRLLTFRYVTVPSGDKSNKRRVSDDDFELSPPQLEPSTKMLEVFAARGGLALLGNFLHSPTFQPIFLPPHTLTALGLFLKLKGFGELLMNNPINLFNFLVLVLGDEADQTSVVPHLTTLPTLPFQILRTLLESANTEDSVKLKHDMLNQGTLAHLLVCLKILSHCSEDLPAAVKSSQTDSTHQYWAKGTGFGTGSTASTWDAELGQSRQRMEEEHVTFILQVLDAYFSLWRVENSSTDSIETGVLSVLKRASILSVFKQYLHNDSILDMARHIPLYSALLAVLRSWTTVPYVNALLFEGRESILYLIEQMSSVVKKYSKHFKRKLSPDEGGIVRLISDVSDTHTILQQQSEALDAATQSSEGESNSSESSADNYIKVLKSLQFNFFSMTSTDEGGKVNVLIDYQFTSALKSAVSLGMDSNMSRTRRLAQEMATLSNSLPLSLSSSVFVRCDEERLDVMQALVTGPADTPYANGCFVFDIFFPSDYPSNPMQVNLQTTGLNSVRFNPNLYNDGKVCLSVLNTWHGKPEERWSSETSSLLQVLVSIQSLILVPEPYFNEPGYERSRGTPAGTQRSLEYDLNIRHATVRWAVLENLINPPPAFKDVITSHFQYKHDEVLSQCELWYSEALTNSSKSTHIAESLKRMIPKLSAQFQKLSAPVAAVAPTVATPVAEDTSGALKTVL